jgi:hypothetical protein
VIATGKRPRCRSYKRSTRAAGGGRACGTAVDGEALLYLIIITGVVVIINYSL